MILDTKTLPWRTELDADRSDRITGQKYRLQPIIKNDRRFKGERGARRAVETEALSQKLIVKLLRDKLKALLPEPLEDVLKREERQRAAVLRLLKRR